LVPICLNCLNCTKFGQLIFRKIIKIVATRCQILRLKSLKCTKFYFGWGFAPDPAGGVTALSQEAILLRGGRGGNIRVWSRPGSRTKTLEGGLKPA